MTAAITATAQATYGRVQLQVTYTTVTQATVVRVHADGSTYVLRDANPALIASTTGVGWVGYDHEAPLDQAVTYRLTSTQDPGVTTTSSAVTVTSDTSYLGSMAWLTDPLQPALSRLLLVADVKEHTQQARTGVLRIMGRADPIAVSDVRLSGSGEIAAYTTTASEAVALRALLATGNILLWRAPATWTGPTWMYLAVGDTSEVSASGVATEGWREWRLPYAVVAAPYGTSAGPVGVTYADVLTAYATYAALIAGEATYDALALQPGP